jgi:hypothetical protein
MQDWPELEGPIDTWRRLRDEIRQEIYEKGYDPDKNAFTQYYGTDALDASLLMIPHTGFLPATDPRMVGTIEAIERELLEDGFVLRYRTSDEGTVDGLHGREGAFLACSFWLADCLHLVGRTDDASALFERLLSLRNDLGLLAEEYDHVAGRQVGNFPQAFSHVSLVNTAFLLTDQKPMRADAESMPVHRLDLRRPLAPPGSSRWSIGALRGVRASSRLARRGAADGAAGTTGTGASAKDGSAEDGSAEGGSAGDGGKVRRRQGEKGRTT